MDKDDTSLIVPQDVLAAFGLLTRLPVRLDTDAAVARGATAAWAYPLVGAGLGVCAILLAAVCGAAGLPPTITAGLVLAFGIVVTGAMHEDGLADSADGLWGGWDKARRLEIMKDSHIGVYGVCAVGLSLLLRWSALAAIVEAEAWWTLVAVGAISRAAMVAVMATLPNARGAGLSQSVGRPAANTMWIAVGIAALLAVVTAEPAALVLAVVATVVCALIAKAKIGGQTGDILGATQQVTEVTVLVAVVVGLA